jgi:hypothetical protein
MFEQANREILIQVGKKFDKRRPETISKRIVKHLEHLGFQVYLQQNTSPLAV